MNLLLLKIGLSSFVLAFAFIKVLISFAKRYNFVDVSDGVIKKHQGEIPHLGGIALAGIILPAALWGGISWQSCLSIFLMLFVGFADDMICLSPSRKFMLQICAASFFPIGFPCLLSLPGGAFLAGAFSFLWTLSLVNAVNLIDVMDGVVVSALAPLFFVGIFFLDQPFNVISTAALCSLLAFYWHNRHPAKIFLGDAGAHFLGGLVALITLQASMLSTSFFSLVAVGSFVSILFVELIMLIAIRTWKGMPFFKPSKDHFSLLLAQAGCSIQMVCKHVFLYQARVAFFGIILFALLLDFSPHLKAAGLFLFTAAVGVEVILWIALAYLLPLRDISKKKSAVGAGAQVDDYPFTPSHAVSSEPPKKDPREKEESAVVNQQ